jgi:predicted CopG family antitoxin
MPHLYTREDYEALARAVLAGMPESEAEKTLEDQRKKGAKGEEVYWLTLKEGARTAKTTIQITQGLKAALNDLKLTERESYASVIDRLMERAARAQVLELKVKELEDKIKIE